MENNSYTLPRPGRMVGQGDQQRPVSLYDNLRNGTMGSGSLNSSGAMSVGNLNAVDRRNGPALRLSPSSMDKNRSPSQANCLSTTVPQNIAGNVIAGRHTPTRNSLRHSRMIVMTRNGKVPRKYLPPVLRHHKLAKSLVALQTLVGIAVSTLALWLFLWAPNLRPRDVPYWSGGPLLMSGVLGLILLCCCRKDYPGYPLACYVFSYKVISLTVSVVALVTCFCASIFAAIHLFFLYTMNCEPENVLNASCECRTPFGYNVRSDNITDSMTRVYTYQDLNCPEVHNILTILLIGSLASNCIGGILVMWYVYLHWSSRYSYVYSQVKTNENKPIIISNKL